LAAHRDSATCIGRWFAIARIGLNYRFGGGPIVVRY
jgi:hypothetical protein